MKCAHVHARGAASRPGRAALAHALIIPSINPGQPAGQHWSGDRRSALPLTTPMLVAHCGAKVGFQAF